jgi:ankyrin repeat protein
MLLKTPEPFYTQMALRLLEKGGSYSEIKINTPDQHGNTPLHYAFCFFKEDIKTYSRISTILLANGADPNSRNNKGETPILYTVKVKKDHHPFLFIKHLDEQSLTLDSGEIAKREAHYSWDLLARDEDNRNLLHHIARSELIGLTSTVLCKPSIREVKKDGQTKRKQGSLSLALDNGGNLPIDLLDKRYLTSRKLFVKNLRKDLRARFRPGPNPNLKATASIKPVRLLDSNHTFGKEADEEFDFGDLDEGPL